MPLWYRLHLHGAVCRAVFTCVCFEENTGAADAPRFGSVMVLCLVVWLLILEERRVSWVRAAAAAKR